MAMDTRIKKGLHVAAHEERSAEVVGLVDGPEDEDKGRSGGVSVIEYTQTRVLEVAPSTLTDHRIVTGRGADPITRAYKLLRTQVLQRLVKENWQTVAVV